MLIFVQQSSCRNSKPGPERARGARPSDHCENSGGMSQRELSEPKANDGPSTVRESKYGEKFSINCALTPADTPRCCACSHARAHASRP